MINMEKKSHGEAKECPDCQGLFILNRSNFYLEIRNKKLKSGKDVKRIRWDTRCKKCSNLYKYSIAKIWKANKKLEELKLIEEGKQFKYSYEVIYFGNKNESYFNGDFGEQKHLDKLLNLKFEDLSENELKFYEDYGK